MKIKKSLPLIEENYFIVTNYPIQRATYQQYKYQLKNNKFYVIKWMKKIIKL